MKVDACSDHLFLMNHCNLLSILSDDCVQLLKVGDQGAGGAGCGPPQTHKARRKFFFADLRLAANLIGRPTIAWWVLGGKLLILHVPQRFGHSQVAARLSSTDT